MKIVSEYRFFHRCQFVQCPFDKNDSQTNQQPLRLTAAATLIRNHKTKIEITAPSKNAFQNIGALQNCPSKKCISELIFLILKKR